MTACGQAKKNKACRFVFFVVRWRGSDGAVLLRLIMATCAHRLLPQSGKNSRKLPSKIFLKNF
jgi:hypothetical protein